MRYDERYTPYVRETGLFPFIQLVSRSTPPNNAPALTALIDHWRPETHSFHLRTGEMTVTLQDIAMITGLPINGNPLCMNTDSDGWRAQMHALIGMVPPEPREPESTKPSNHTTRKCHWLTRIAKGDGLLLPPPAGQPPPPPPQ